MSEDIKNIVLVDNELKIIEHVLKSTNWVIAALVTGCKADKYENNPRVKKIYTEWEFLNNRDLSGLEYQDLENLWHAQLKVENCFNRFLVDYQLGKWNYYRGYTLVKQIFENDKIDLVIVKGMNHGHTWDRIVTDYATYLKIDNYNIEVMLQYTRIVYNNYTHKMVKVNNNGRLNVNNSLFYNEDYGNSKINKKGFWNSIYKLSYRLFGSLGIDIAKCIRYRDLGENRLGVNVIERMLQYEKIKRCRKYVDSISEQLDTNKKYICFALHFEPEAVVAGRTVMGSQIAAIQMLASNLPADWVLYVKEHPSQYMVNRSNYYGYLYGVATFKTKRFYEEINRIEKVKFLNRETSNRLILENCQAMATLNGTIAAEAVSFEKPVLLFAAERTIFELANGFYIVRSYEDCRRFIEKIVSHEIVDYDNFDEICQKYIIDFSDETQGFKQAVEAIKRDLI